MVGEGFVGVWEAELFWLEGKWPVDECLEQHLGLGGTNPDSDTFQPYDLGEAI